MTGQKIVKNVLYVKKPELDNISITDVNVLNADLPLIGIILGKDANVRCVGSVNIGKKKATNGMVVNAKYVVKLNQSVNLDIIGLKASV
jgi:hypothetical protein